MIVDARTLVDGATLEADVCIAGAGAAGMTIALDLRASGLSVLLLESGGAEQEPEVQSLSEGRMVGIDTWNVRAMRIRALGGTTGHWAGWCRPLTPQDFEARDYISLSGWPIKYSDLVPFYRRACETVQIGEFDWNSAARAKATGKALLPLGAAIDQRYYQFSPPTRFGRVYSDVLAQADDVRVLTFANVRDIRLDQRRGRVESFACRTLQGNHVQRSRRPVCARAGRHRERPRSAGLTIPGIRRRGKRPRRGGQVFHGASPLLRLDRASCTRQRSTCSFTSADRRISSGQTGPPWKRSERLASLPTSRAGRSS